MSNDVGTQRGLYNFITQTDAFLKRGVCLCGHKCADLDAHYWKATTQTYGNLYNHIYNLEPGERDRHILMSVGEMF